MIHVRILLFIANLFLCFYSNDTTQLVLSGLSVALLGAVLTLDFISPKGDT